MTIRSFLCFVFLAVILVFMPVTVPAGIINLPETGQTTSYYPGDDGDLMMGVEFPNPRFVNNGDGTMTDMLTGYRWLQHANCAVASGYDADGQVLWENSLDFVDDINTGAINPAPCGYTKVPADKWRVPSINELESLVNSGYMDEDCGGSPCTSLAEWLMNQGFTNVQAGGSASPGGTNANGAYWVSTPYMSNQRDAWAVEMSDGDMQFTNSDLGDTKINVELFVWPVTGGQTSAPDPTYPANIPKTMNGRAFNSAFVGCTWQNPPLNWLLNNNCNIAQWNLISLQDEYIQDTARDDVGVAWPGPNPPVNERVYERFANNGDNTLTDDLTGLMWLRDTNCIATNYPGADPDIPSPPGVCTLPVWGPGCTTNADCTTPGAVCVPKPVDGKVTWQQGLDFVAGINDGTYSNCSAGYNDWRVPNRKELRSMLKWYDWPRSFLFWIEQWLMDSPTVGGPNGQCGVSGGAPPSGFCNAQLGANGVCPGGSTCCTAPQTCLWNGFHNLAWSGQWTSTSFDANNAVAMWLGLGRVFQRNKSTFYGYIMPVRTALGDDGDGVPVEVEDNAPNFGDGNGDGTRDLIQPLVTSLPAANGTDYVTVITDGAVGGCTQNMNVLTAAASPPDPGVSYPLGVTGFEIRCATGPASMQILYHGSSDPTGLVYRNYGSTGPAFGAPAWYDMPGAVLDTVLVGGQTVVRASFSIAENGTGDHNDLSNIIVSLGGPGLLAPAVAIPTMTKWGIIVFTVLTMLGTVYYIRKRKMV